MPHAMSWSPAGWPPARRAAAIAGWTLLLFLIAALLQLIARNPYDADTAYHVAVARLIRAHGVLHAFPWTTFSWLADHYADKELLFHLALVPLADQHWTTAARIMGALCGGLALTALYAVLCAERVERAELWSLVPLVASAAFTFRFALVRPHLLSLALALVIAWACARRRLAVLGAASFLYPLVYVGWPMALGLAVIVEAVRPLAGERPGWRPAAVVGAGLVAGLLAHPNFPEIVRFAWIVNVGILVDTAWSGRPGFDLGLEFDPFRAGDALRFLAIPALLAGLSAALAWRRRREDALPLAFAACAWVLLAMTLRTARFVEYAVPFAAAAAALAATGAALPRASAAVVLAAGLAMTAVFGRSTLASLATRGEDVPPPFAAAFRAAVPEGAQVFTCEWGLTGSLMLALPERRFMVALDPFLFWKEDPARYDDWRRLVREGGADAADRIRRRFGARFVLCTATPSNAPLLRALSADPGVARVVKSPLWYLYDLTPRRAGAAPPR